MWIQPYCCLPTETQRICIVKFLQILSNLIKSDYLFFFVMLLGRILYADTIEVPRNLISNVDDSVPEFVSVYALSRIEYAAQVLVEPVSVEDWELLEIYSNLMEEGGLLRQVSVIYPEQTLQLRVDGIDRVNIRVKEVKTQDSPDPGNDENSIWPDLPSNQRSTEKNSSPKCVLLIQDTEMIVEPKTRQQKKDPSWSNPFRLIPSDFDWGVSLAKLSSLTGRDAFHVGPGCVLVKTEEWPFDTEWARIKSNDSDETRVVTIMTSPEVPRSSAGMSIACYFRIFYLDWKQIQSCLR